VFLDGSQISLQALQWALQHVLTLPTDVLYLVNIIPHEEFQEDSDRILRQGYEKARLSRVIIHKVSLSADEASSVGKAILEFVNEKNIDVAVMGDRGMGSMKSSLMGSLGLGSVSEFCARNLKCPVLVVKNGEAVSR
jgi:nucleotide-binding universal stress UspA family protein